MKRSLTLMVLATLFTVICIMASGTALAQSEQSQQTKIIKEPNKMASINCPEAQGFTFGNGANSIAFCISDDGNIQNLESPVTYTLLSQREGYVVCGTGAANAYSAAIAGSGWNASGVPSQPNGPHTFPLSITRNSTDGKFQLKQSFDWDTENKEITVTMVLKNISNAAIANVKLARYFDADIHADSNNDLYDADADSVLAHDTNPNVPRRALMLSALSLALTHKATVEDYSDWAMSREGCTPVPTVSSMPAGPADYAARLTFDLGTLAANQSRTVIVLYKRF